MGFLIVRKKVLMKHKELYRQNIIPSNITGMSTKFKLKETSYKKVSKVPGVGD